MSTGKLSEQDDLNSIFVRNKTRKKLKCLGCGKDIPASTDHASDEPYMFICNDCRDEIGNGGLNEKEAQRVA